MEKEGVSLLYGYLGMTDIEVMDTYIVGVGVKNEWPVIERQSVIIFLKLVLGENVEISQEALLYKMLGKPHFQFKFVEVIGALMLTLEIVEAYEMLEKLQQNIDKLANSVHLKKYDFFDVLPFKPRTNK